MENGSKGKRFVDVSLFIIIAVFILGAILSCVPFDVAEYVMPDNIQISNTNYTITTNASDGLGEFADGASYVYTDKDKVDGFRAGSEDYDITTQKVAKTSSNRGEIANPYVIASEADWTRFAKNLDDGSIPNKGSGQYFVLAKDLDFSAETFRPVRFFNGTFYGIGHKLQNISLNGAEWQYWNTSTSTYAQIPTSGAESPLGYGVFCKTVNSTIADVIVENFDYQQMPQMEIFNSRNINSTGGIVGQSNGEDYFLNCHTVGSIISTIAYPLHTPAGGIIGAHATTAVLSPIFIYRCSSEVNFTTQTTPSYTTLHSGIIGDTYLGGSVYLYDCAANVISNTSTGAHTSSTIALGVAGGQSIYMENVVGTIDVNSTVNAGSGALLGTYAGSVVESIKNCYVEGQYGAPSAKKPYAGIGAAVQVTVNGSTVKNINVVKPTGTEYWSQYIWGYAITLSGQTEYSTSDEMLSKAKTFFGNNYSQIWDVSKIGGTYDPDNSPVRNYMRAYITYRNLTNGGNSNELVTLKTGEHGDPFIVGDQLYEPSDAYMATKSNHVFLGWTDDKDGNSEPFEVLPTGFYGDVDLYAVWGLPSDYASSNVKSSLSLKDNVSEITYDSQTSITLIGEVKDDGGAMSPKVTYYWDQNGGDKAKNTTGQLSVKTVADSGSYTYNYRMQDSNEPLWMYYSSCPTSETKTIKINKGELSLTSFNLTTDCKAYVGKPLSELKYILKVQNSAGVEVSIAQSGWLDPFGSVQKDATNKATMTVVPSDRENYKDSYNIEVEFSSETLKLTFKMAELTGQTLKVDVVYDQIYGTGEIIYLFESVFLDALANNPAYKSIAEKGMAPYLANADELKADSSYRGAPLVEDSSEKALYNAGTRYEYIKEEHIITVFFEEVKYTVKFDLAGGTTTGDVSDKAYGYGKFVPKPVDPTKDDLLFLGWYFEDADGVERAWRFNSETDKDGNVIPQDKVTGNITLRAEYLSANNLDEVVFEVKPTAKFEALGTIDSGDYLTVTAKYSGEKDGQTSKKDVIKDYNEYRPYIEYGRMDGDTFVKDYTTLKVVEGGMYIRVGVMFNGEVVYSAPKKITVSPKDITDLTEKFNFEDKDGIITKNYDGTSKALPQISKSQLDSLTGGQITGVEYVYTNILTGEVVTEPINVGTYKIQVNYITPSADLYARPTELTLKIVTQQEVRVEWTNSSLMFSGSEQYPKVAKIYDAETGAEVLVNTGDIVYSGDTNATAVKGGNEYYTVKVSFGDGYSIVEGEECKFTIEKAIFAIPTYTSGMIFYDGTEKSLESYLGESFNPLLMEIVNGGVGTEVNTYVATIRLKDTINCNWEDGSFGTQQIRWQIEPAQLIVSWDKWEFVSDGESAYAPKISGLFGLAGADSFNYDTDFIYKIYDEDGNLLEVSEVDEIGSYKIVASFNGDVKNYTLDATSKEWYFVVVPKSGMTILTIEWGETQFLYDGSVHYPTFSIKDSNGRDVTEEVSSLLKFSDNYRKEKELGTYTVKVSLNDSAANEYFIRSGSTCKYKIVDENGYAPDEEETANRGDGNKDPDGNGPVNIEEFLQKYWQPIVSAISILLILIFTGKGIGYASKRKENKRTVERKYSSYYAVAGTGTGLFGLTYTNWTIVACIMMGVAVLSFVFMLLEKRGYKKSQRDLEDAKEEYERNEKDIENRRRIEENQRRDEDMKMMFMHMMGGNANGGMNGNGQQGGFVYAGQGFGAEEMKGMITEVVTALLPGMQQMLPQQASSNDELVQKLVEQNAQNEEVIKNLAQGQEKLMKKLAEKPAERVVEREVAATSVSEEVLDRLADKLQPVGNDDEALKNLIEGQKAIMQRLAEQPIVQGASDETILKVVNHSEQNDETIKQLLKNQETLME
ncbi:MAG: InlB B-repeat-containing protein, partial [Clostridia bacterium]|nr:InlB B-repeat-containing protein [Clostridia bacterium]